MPDLVAHYVASYLVARQVVRGRLRALAIALAGLAPDVDALLRMHRWFTHSLLMIAPILAAYAALRLLGRRGWARVALLVAALYALHIAMDIFTAPVPLLWPLSSECVGIHLSIEGVVAPGALALVPRVSIVVATASFAPHVVRGPVLSLVGTALLITCAAIEVASALRTGLRRMEQGSRTF